MRPRLRAGSVVTLVVASVMTFAAGSGASAHRRDEYLQAARVAIDPAGVQLELDLTPGIALAEAIIAGIDGNRDGTLAVEEQRIYARLVVSELTLEVDGTPVRAQLATVRFPDPEAMRRGEGTIRLQTTARLPPLSSGPHQLLFRNRHHRDGSVYLANALVPASDAVAVTAQRRDGDQTELTIDYLLRTAPSRPTAAWFVTVAAAIGLLVLWLARARVTTAGAAWRPARRNPPR